MPICKVAQVHDRYRSRTDLDVCQRPFSTANTVEPVSVMTRRLNKMHVAFPEWFLDNFVRLTRQHTTVDMKFARAAVEHATARTTVFDLDAILILKPHAGLGVRVAWRNDSDRAGVVQAQSPMRNVVVVCAHIGVLASRVLTIGTPIGEMVVHAARTKHRIVRAHRCWTQPKIPLESRLHGLLGQITPHARRAHADRNSLDLPEPAALNDFHRLAKATKHIRSLLATHLHHAAMHSRLLDTSLGLMNRQSERLFAVHV